ncbi:conserved Plasmodium protein, unknown function [Plasmodium chabaudi chabaudi]|uniref:Uncharacterized protein n=1 Tax=Plasmodium chabaudi chabaudi TaxID=31271 RepID=A0A4V0K0P2_PLACU|nr:conserved Plasmodium protein, unknown function [Plasmodium chabaudi chabaudi]VTZ66471.1 conserved Plasmodium protein, unknown function [Plasmodium chabaudi chabaudi]|eukprot:XP_016655544.1 conserved Plasmodium protein, unknown function [Plasmodium chabaudi chabaudi]
MKNKKKSLKNNFKLNYDSPYNCCSADGYSESSTCSYSQFYEMHKKNMRKKTEKEKKENELFQLSQSCSSGGSNCISPIDSTFKTKKKKECFPLSNNSINNFIKSSYEKYKINTKTKEDNFKKITSRIKRYIKKMDDQGYKKYEDGKNMGIGNGNNTNKFKPPTNIQYKQMQNYMVEDSKIYTQPGNTINRYENRKEIILPTQLNKIKNLLNSLSDASADNEDEKKCMFNRSILKQSQNKLDVESSNVVESCIFCSKFEIVEKIKKIAFNKIKPICASCFIIFLNLIKINSIICIWCFKIYFPYKDTIRCAICKRQDSKVAKKYDDNFKNKHNITSIINELNIFISLYNYQFSNNINTDMFLNFFININYCFQDLYSYLSSHQVLITSKNCVYANYSKPFWDLLTDLNTIKNKKEVESDENDYTTNLKQTYNTEKKNCIQYLHHALYKIKKWRDYEISDSSCLKKKKKSKLNKLEKVIKNYITMLDKPVRKSMTKLVPKKNEENIMYRQYSKPIETNRLPIQDEYKKKKESNKIEQKYFTYLKLAEMKHQETIQQIKSILNEDVIKNRSIEKQSNTLDTFENGNKKNDELQNADNENINRDQEVKNADNEICPPISDTLNEEIKEKEIKQQNISQPNNYIENISMKEENKGNEIKLESAEMKNEHVEKKEINKICTKENIQNFSEESKNSFENFSKIIITSLLKLKHEKIQSSYYHLKNVSTKINQINFNKTVRKYYSKGVFLLYYIKYVQKQESEIQRVFRTVQAAEADVENFKRKFRIHYGKDANLSEINKSIYEKCKLLNRGRIQLENKIKNFEDSSTIKQIYQIIDEFSDILETSLNKNKNEIEQIEKRNLKTVNKYLKKMAKEKKRKYNELNKVVKKYEYFHDELFSILQILNLLYGISENGNNCKNIDFANFNSASILRKIKMFLYTKKIKKINDSLKKGSTKRVNRNYSISNISYSMCPYKKTNFKHIYEQDKNCEKYRPKIICVLDIQKKNFDKFLTDNNPIKIVDKNNLIFIKELYSFDSIYINKIYIHDFMSNIVNNYITLFVNQNNVTIFNFSLHYSRNKKNVFLNSFKDYFHCSKNRESPKKRHNRFSILQNGHKEGGLKNSAAKNCQDNSGVDNRAYLNGTADVKCKTMNLKKNTTVIKIINELKKKINEKYSYENYNLKLNVYAQKNKALYNINKCVFFKKNIVVSSEEGKRSNIKKYRIKIDLKNIKKMKKKNNIYVCEKKRRKSNEEVKNKSKDETHKKENYKIEYLNCVNLKKIKNINKHINYKNINKFKKYSIIFVIKLELLVSCENNICIKKNKKKKIKKKKKIFHFTLVDIAIPIFDIMKKKNQTAINYFLEFKNKQNFESIFINYIQSQLFNTQNTIYHSYKTIQFLLQTNPQICFLLYIRDDFFLSNHHNLYSLPNEENVPNDQNENKTNHEIVEPKKTQTNQNTIIKLLYIYYWCIMCEGKDSGVSSS